jgi:hypothetical protein
VETVKEKRPLSGPSSPVLRLADLRQHPVDAFGRGVPNVAPVHATLGVLADLLADLTRLAGVTEAVALQVDLKAILRREPMGLAQVEVLVDRLKRAAHRERSRRAVLRSESNAAHFFLPRSGVQIHNHRVARYL